MLFRSAVGPLLLPVRRQHAMPALKVEANFKLARRALVNCGGQRIRNRLAGFGVNPQRDAMFMLAPVLDMPHPKIGQMVEPVIFSDAAHALLPIALRSNARRRAG